MLKLVKSTTLTDSATKTSNCLYKSVHKNSLKELREFKENMVNVPFISFEQAEFC